MVHFSTPFCITYVYLSYVAWRRERDSNPRVRKHKLISSQPRYDHFAFAKRILAAGELSLHTKKQKPQPFIELRLYGGEGGIYEPVFAPRIAQTVRATCANQHVAVQSTAHAGFKSGDFHDKRKRRSCKDLLFLLWRRRWDLNPRDTSMPYEISSHASSTT